MHDWTAEMEAVSGRRDRGSFMRIYDHFAPRVRRYLLGMGVGSGMAEELTQEALLRLWQRAHQYDAGRSSLGTWLFRIARNLHIDRIRSELDGNLDGTRPAGTETYAEAANLRQVVQQLPDIQARLIRMSYFEAKSQQTIADELDMPLGTVKSHLRRAFLTLRTELSCGR